jgi:RHS repeat-associated protein
LNTPRIITNSANQIVWRWDNTDPFGNNPADENPSGLGAFRFDMRFPGQTLDRETGLHYNYFRDCYDPATGRYCQSDPIGLRGGINTYGYVFSNPVAFSDSRGLQVGRAAAGAAGMPPGTLSPAQLEAASALDRLGRAAAEAASKLLPTTLCYAFPAHCAAAAAAAAENAGNTRGLPPEGVQPPIPDADQCKPGPASRPSEADKGGESLWDPRGGEWRLHPGNRWHNPHWDYNSHTPGSRWENIPHGDLPPVRPIPDPK